MITMCLLRTPLDLRDVPAPYKPPSQRALRGIVASEAVLDCPECGASWSATGAKTAYDGETKTPAPAEAVIDAAPQRCAPGLTRFAAARLRAADSPGVAEELTWFGLLGHGHRIRSGRRSSVPHWSEARW